MYQGECVNNIANQELLKIANLVYSNGDIEFKPDLVNPASLFEDYKNCFDLSVNDAMELYASPVDPYGWQHYKYQQKYKGVIVENSKYFIHAQNNFAIRAGGHIAKGLSLETTPAITAEQAFEIALENINAQKYYWEDSASERNIKRIFHKPDTTFKPSANLVIYNNSQTDSAQYYLLAYTLTVNCMIPEQTIKIYIDAINGNVISKSGDISDYGDVSGTTYTKYSGDNVPITCDYTGGHYILNDNARGITTTHYDAQNGWHSISSSNTYFDNSAVDEVGGDAHWGAEKTYDYFKNTFNRNGWDNDSAELTVRINYDVGSSFINGVITLGGYHSFDNNTQEWTSLDIIGHEFTHGILNTSFTDANYTGSFGFAEGVCDYFGTMIKFKVKPESADWIWAKEITEDGTGLRNLADPNAKNMPDSYMDSYYVGCNMDNHCKSTIWSHMFYLLSEGGAGVNGVGNNYLVNGIGKETVANWLYQSITNYIPNEGGYILQGLVAAAKEQEGNVFGECSNELIQLYNALYAVNLKNDNMVGYEPNHPLPYYNYPYTNFMEQYCQPQFNSSNTSTNHFYDVLELSGDDNECQNKFVVPAGFTSVATAGNKIILKDGFKATDGSSFHAYISPCAEGQTSTEKLINNETNNNTPDVKPLLKENNYCNIYPNPASNFINIEYVSGYDGNVCVELSDILGQKIITKTFSVKKGSNLLTLPLNYNPELSGLYYISIRTENKFISNKIIIQ